jgi:MFS superfamily sulfate permease-like transporter
VALGGANLATGLFSGYPISSSSSRTAVAASAGQRTQLAGVVGALAIAVMLLWAPGLLQALPQSALAAVVIAAAIGLIVLPAWQRLWTWRRSEFAVALVTFLGVILIGVVEGILIAVVLSLLAFLRRAWWPHDAILGRQTGVKGYHDLTYYPEARRIPGLVLYRFDAPLSFFNADHFRQRVLEIVAEADPPVAWVVVAAEPITDVDTSAAEQLGRLLDELEPRSVTLAFAELKDPVKTRLRRYGLVERIGEDHLYPTLGTAVAGYVHATGAHWVDWEDAAAEAAGETETAAGDGTTDPA